MLVQRRFGIDSGRTCSAGVLQGGCQGTAQNTSARPCVFPAQYRKSQVGYRTRAHLGTMYNGISLDNDTIDSACVSRRREKCKLPCNFCHNLNRFLSRVHLSRHMVISMVDSFFNLNKCIQTTDNHRSRPLLAPKGFERGFVCDPTVQ